MYQIKMPAMEQSLRSVGKTMNLQALFKVANKIRNQNFFKPTPQVGDQRKTRGRKGPQINPRPVR